MCGSDLDSPAALPLSGSHSSRSFAYCSLCSLAIEVIFHVTVKVSRARKSGRILIRFSRARAHSGSDDVPEFFVCDPTQSIRDKGINAAGAVSNAKNA